MTFKPKPVTDAESGWLDQLAAQQYQAAEEAFAKAQAASEAYQAENPTLADKQDQTLSELEKAVPEVSERFAEAAPAMQSALMRGLGQAYMARQGVAGRGAPASGAQLASAAAAQAGAQTDVAGKIASYGIDQAAQQVEGLAYLHDLMKIETKDLEAKLAQVYDDSQTIVDNADGNKQKAIQGLQAQLDRYTQAGDDAAATHMRKLLASYEETGNLGTTSKKGDDT